MRRLRDHAAERIVIKRVRHAAGGIRQIAHIAMRSVAEMLGRPRAPADLILRQRRLAVGEDAKPGELFQRTKIKTAAK